MTVKYLSLFLVVLGFIASCTPSMPQRVNPELLRGADAQRIEELEKLERKMILLPDQKLDIERKLYKTLDKVEAYEAEEKSLLEMLAADKKAVGHPENKKDPALLEAANQKVADTTQKLVPLRAALVYWRAMEARDRAEQALFAASLTKEVGAQMLLQAEIANETQSKKGTGKSIAVAPYKSYYEATQKAEKDAEIALKRAEDKLAKAKEGFDPTLVETQPEAK